MLNCINAHRIPIHFKLPLNRIEFIHSSTLHQQHFSNQFTIENERAIATMTYFRSHSLSGSFTLNAIYSLIANKPRIISSTLLHISSLDAWLQLIWKINQPESIDAHFEQKSKNWKFYNLFSLHSVVVLRICIRISIWNTLYGYGEMVHRRYIEVNAKFWNKHRANHTAHTQHCRRMRRMFQIQQITRKKFQFISVKSI